MTNLRKVLIVATVLACALPLAASAAVSPTALLGSIFAAARSERSVHYVVVARPGVARVSLVGDAAVSQGIQRITYGRGSKTGHVTVIVSADTAYVRGDAFTLVNYMGFKAPAAATYANAWVLIPRSDPDYTTVAGAVRLQSTLDQLKLSGPVATVLQTTVAGQQVLGVRGKGPFPGGTAVATLYARASGSPLPVQEVIGRGSRQATVTFSKWNQPVHLAIPANTVQIATTGLE